MTPRDAWTYSFDPKAALALRSIDATLRTAADGSPLAAMRRAASMTRTRHFRRRWPKSPGCASAPDRRKSRKKGNALKDNDNLITERPTFVTHLECAMEG